MIIPKSCEKWIKVQRRKCKNSLQYIDTITKEFKIIEAYLPINCKSILDVGCGVGGMDVLLYNKYKAELHLLDGNFLSEKIVPYGFKKKEFVYNSIEATTDMMIKNHINNYSVYDIEKGFPQLRNIDVVISVYSWGFHYTVEKYIDYIIKVLSKDGILIMDLRKSEEELYIVETCFDYIFEIKTDNPKSMRICAKGKKIWQ